jgi:hypothetical protein
MPPRLRALLWALALAPIVAGCTGNGSGGTTTAPPLGADVLRQYVAALDRGDSAAANALRCTKGQVPPNLLESWAKEVADVRTALGGALRVATVRQVDPATLSDLNGNPPAAQLAYTLRRVSGPATQPIDVAMVTENGVTRLCGALQEPSLDAQKALAVATITPAPGEIADLATALPATVLPGYTQAADLKVADLSGLPGATEGWSRVWTSAHGGLHVSLLRTKSGVDANTLAHRILAAPGVDTAEVVGNLTNGFVGVSVVGSAWTWVQPADVGARVDRAVAVVGEVVVSVEVGGVTAAGGHSLLQQAVKSLSFT